MKKQQYENLLSFFKSRPRLLKLTVILQKAITIGVYIFYPVLLVALVALHDVRFWRVLCVPAVSFVTVSIVRAVINAPRPYEVFGTTPLINKKRGGKSMPSRHTFSVFIIAVATMYINFPLGAVIAVLGLFLAASRVFHGVHFIRDVAVGFLAAAVFGLIGFVII